MATLIQNIGSLDARKATREAIETIAKIKNIGSILVTKESREMLMAISQENIGSIIELDIDVKLHVGPFKFTKEMLETAPEPIKMSIVGPVSFEFDISPELLSQKLAWLNVTGPIEVMDTISGILMSKLSDAVGPIDVIKSNEIKLKGKIILENDYLNSLPDHSIINCSGTLELYKDIDLNLFNRKIKQISIGSKLSIFEDQKDIIMKKIFEDYDAVNSETKIGIKPTLFTFNKVLTARLVVLKRNYYYVPANTKFDAFNFANIHKEVISSEGVLILAEDINAELLHQKNISFCTSKRVYFPNTLNQIMAKYLINDTQGVPYDPEKSFFFNGDQKFSPIRLKNMKENATMINFGNLSFSADLDIDLFYNKLANIDNYGSIDASQDLCSVLQDKMRYNEGAIETNDCNDSDDSEDLSKYDNIIQNAGSYIL